MATSLYYSAIPPNEVGVPARANTTKMPDPRTWPSKPRREWVEGYRSYVLWQEEAKNPYMPETTASQQWNSGFTVAMAEVDASFVLRDPPPKRAEEQK